MSTKQPKNGNAIREQMIKICAMNDITVIKDEKKPDHVKVTVTALHETIDEHHLMRFKPYEHSVKNVHQRLSDAGFKEKKDYTEESHPTDNINSSSHSPCLIPKLPSNY